MGAAPSHRARTVSALLRELIEAIGRTRDRLAPGRHAVHFTLVVWGEEGDEWMQFGSTIDGAANIERLTELLEHLQRSEAADEPLTPLHRQRLS